MIRLPLGTVEAMLCGLEQLAGLKGLKSISLNGCRTTRQGRDALNARLNCHITH